MGTGKVIRSLASFPSSVKAYGEVGWFVLGGFLGEELRVDLDTVLGLSLGLDVIHDVDE